MVSNIVSVRKITQDQITEKQEEKNVKAGLHLGLKKKRFWEGCGHDQSQDSVMSAQVGMDVSM